MIPFHVYGIRCSLEMYMYGQKGWRNISLRDDGCFKIAPLGACAKNGGQHLRKWFG